MPNVSAPLDLGAGRAPRPTLTGHPARHIGWLVTAGLALFAVFLADYATGADVALSFFYLMPIVLATWKVGRHAGLVFCLLAVVGWTMAYFLTGRPYEQSGVLFWNAGIEAAIFVSGCFAVAAVHEARARQQELLGRLRDTYRLLDDEMHRVGDIQRGMLPGAPPMIPGHRLAVSYVTSTRAGGDYYDFFDDANGRVGILIADVSGHGAPAAVLMAMMRILLHTASPRCGSPDQVLDSINRKLTGNIPDGQFVTACFVSLDPASHVLDYASAGHNPMALARGTDRSIEHLTTSSGPPLGLFADAAFSRHRARLEPGDTLLLYTDGLVEAMNPAGEMFGEERMHRLLAELAGADPEEVRDRLLAAVSDHGGAGFPADDVTMILLRRLTAGTPQ